MNFKIKISFFIGFLFLLLPAFTNNTRIYLDKNWSYATEENSEVFVQTNTLDFVFGYPLKKNYEGYIWLKNTFIIPNELQNKDLALYLGVPKIAQETYLNGYFVGSSGSFPPNEFYNGEKPSAYPLPKSILNFGGTVNTLVIKLWINTSGKIGNRPFIDLSSNVFSYQKKTNLSFSEIPFSIFIFLIFIAFLYFFFYIIRPIEVSSLSFSLITFLSALYLITICYGELPFDFSKIISYLTFQKIFNAIVPYCAMYLSVSFVRDYLNFKEKVFIKFLRRTLLLSTILITSFSKTMYSFHIAQIICYIICSLQFIFSTMMLIKSIKNKDAKAFYILSGFSPVLITIIVSTIFYYTFTFEYTKLFIIFGWQLTIFFFLCRLLINYVSLFSKIEYINSNLEKLIKDKTFELQQANEILKNNNIQLETEKNKTQKELELAANVQQNFYTLKNTNFKNWEIAFYFEPLESVSGDLYDIYTNNDDELNGIGIFDISGHGLSSSLVTMLVKNIIQQEISDGKNQELVKILNNINNRVITEKGNIENYLTGIIGRINGNEIELVNAGHPEPILVHSDGKINFLERENKSQCGVIGIAEFPTNFISTKYILNKGDFIIFYTDGVTDCQNEFGEYYNKENFISSIKNHYTENIKILAKSLKDDLYNFIGTTEVKDDITIFILKLKD